MYSREFLAALMVAGCTAPAEPSDPVVGRWDSIDNRGAPHAQESFTFSADGTLKSGETPLGTWRRDDETTITFDGQDDQFTVVIEDDLMIFGSVECQFPIEQCSAVSDRSSGEQLADSAWTLRTVRFEVPGSIPELCMASRQVALHTDGTATWTTTGTCDRGGSPGSSFSGTWAATSLGFDFITPGNEAYPFREFVLGDAMGPVGYRRTPNP